MHPAEYSIGNQHFLLLKEKALYWINENAIVISDPHFGKGSHFRKNGIYVPDTSFIHDLETLETLIFDYQADRLIITGDLFHSSGTDDCQLFSKMLGGFDGLQTILVKGNHDILHDLVYHQMGIITYTELLLNGIYFTHCPTEPCEKSYYTISGHIHPAVSLQGKGRQYFTLPCYAFADDQALLPAFGNFTGMQMVDKQSFEDIFVIAGTKVLKL